MKPTGAPTEISLRNSVGDDIEPSYIRGAGRRRVSGSACEGAALASSREHAYWAGDGIDRPKPALFVGSLIQHVDDGCLVVAEQPRGVRVLDMPAKLQFRAVGVLGLDQVDHQLE
jgi:hypothetical protein